MTGTNHGLTGAAIALLVKEPVLAVPLSYVSHFICDAIPHFGVKDTPEESEVFSNKFNIILVIDFLSALGLVVALGIIFPQQRWVIWASMIAAASPDLAWSYYRLYIERIKKRKPRYDWLSRLHMRIQWSQTYPGAFLELAWFMTLGAIILAQR